MYTVKLTPEFDLWLNGLRNGPTRIRMARRLVRVQRGLPGDVQPAAQALAATFEE